MGELQVRVLNGVWSIVKETGMPKGHALSK